MDCAMSFEIKVTSIPKPPDSLYSILEKFTESDSPLLERIMDIRADFKNGRTPDDINILHLLLTYKPGEEKKVYERAYIYYMGLTFYYHDSVKTMSAWYYYAKAQHCRGIFETWDMLLNQLCREDIERQQKAKAAKKKSEKNNKDLTDAFLKAIYEKKPPEGWASTKELIDATLPEVEETHIRNTDRIYPLYENLEDAMRRWLKNHREIYQAYDETASPNNKDVL